MKKIIFLDIDGVISLNFQYFDENCVENLKKIIQYTNADICLSSFWRLDFFDEQSVVRMINNIGGNYIGKTIEYDGLNRFEEIWEYVVRNKPDTWVILDDYTPFSISPEYDEDKIRIVEKVWVETYFRTGLSLENAKQAIRILNNDDSFDFPENDISPNFY